MMKKSAGWVFIFLMGIAVQGHAEETYKLETMEVTADKQTSAERNIEQIDIKAEAKPVASTVPDTLDKVSGLDIQRRSIMTPKSGQVRIRGFDERRTLIMLDGRPLNGTGVMGGYFIDWSVLSLQDWQSIDLGKGAFSAKYGNTLGGTIDLIPIEPGEDPVFNAALGYKRYNTFSAVASGSGSYGGFGGVVSGGYQKSDGNLRNSDAERGDFSSRFTYALGDDGKLIAGFRYTDGDFNMPVENQADKAGFDPSYPESISSYLAGPGVKFPTGDTHGDGSYYNKKRYELDFGFEKNFFGFQSEMKVYYNNEDREDVFYSYNDEDVVLKREATPDRSWGWVTRFSRAISDHLIGFGADGNYQGYGGTENTYVKEGYFTSAPSDGADEWDATKWHGVYLDDHWTISRSFDLYAGLRYDKFTGDRTADQVIGYNNGKPAGFEKIDAEFDEDVLQPKLGLVYRPVEGVTLHGRFARSARFPDNPAFYWYYGGYRPEVDSRTDVIRSDLTYEDALQYEAGVTYTGIPGLSLRCNYYYYQVDDYIRWIFGYAPSRLVYNIDRVDFQGIEFDAEQRLWGCFYAFANFTWQETEKTGDVMDGSNELTDSLSELPEYKFNMGVKYQREDGMTAKATLRWVDDREVPYLTTGSAPDGTPAGSAVTLKTLDSFAVVDLSLKYPVWNKGVKTFITAGVENLFDEGYEEEYGFPAPGQTFSIGVEFAY